jgi:hypothetical protein
VPMLVEVQRLRALLPRQRIGVVRRKRVRRRRDRERQIQRWHGIGSFRRRRGRRYRGFRADAVHLHHFFHEFPEIPALGTVRWRAKQLLTSLLATFALCFIACSASFCASRPVCDSGRSPKASSRIV